jgi:hypothetical protein
MANTFEIRDLEATLINEECPIDVEVEMLELSSTQLSKNKEELTLKVVCPKVD